MYHFMKLLESAREHGIGSMSMDRRDMAARRPTNPAEWAAFELCQPFVFSPSTDPHEQMKVELNKDEFVKQTDVITDAPFPVFSMEVLGSDEPVGALTNGPVTLDYLNREVHDAIYVFCIVAIEVSPTNFINFMSGQTKRSHLSVVRPSAHIIRPLVDKYLVRLTKEKLGMESTRATVKIGSGNAKRIHRIRRVIHVAPKKYVNKLDPATSRTINWTHRFEVRGHWRVVEGLGKDRAGDYCVNGFTWVSHHTRGPENLPLVKKVRVIDASNSPSKGPDDDKK